MPRTYSNLTLATLDSDGNARTCNYWYLVRADGLPHTAFNRRASLVAWLERLGLTLSADMPPHGVHSYQEIRGTYRTEMHGSYDSFYALQSIEDVPTLSNGDWTLGRVTRDADGLRTLHTLAPACRHRPVFNHAECRALHG